MTADNGTKSPEEIAVWDVGVRLFHWLLVAAVAVAAYTGFWGHKSQIDIHVIAGTGIAALVVFRLIWGVTGSTYTRFSSFVVLPATMLRHLHDLKAGRAQAHIGHNPLGAWMILALLAFLVLICVSGVIALGGVIKEGPLAPVTTYAMGLSAKNLHNILAFALSGLIALHVLGAIFESIRTKENLTYAMLTGRKRRRRESEAQTPVHARPLLAFGGVASIALGATGAVAHLGSKPALGVPVAAINPTYAKECGACHSVHHPTLAPAATWHAIFGSLDMHFGDNASLDPETTRQLASYAIANSAEQWDTRVANLMRVPSKVKPLRITEARAWKRVHGRLAEALFESKPIGGKLNCTNCHKDAETGVFAPRSIAIKKEKTP